jgi:hypothetical protein
MSPDPYLSVIAAIDCLKDLGFDKPTIQARITQWISKSGESGDWRDLRPEQQLRLGQAMQKFFEAEHRKSNVRMAA